MGSKKLKKKKIKLKKFEKARKYKTVKQKITAESNKQSSSEEKSSQENDFHNRLTDIKKYSRSCIPDKYISKVNHFSQIREYYFSYLQNVLKDNCVYCNSQVSEDVLGNLSLDIEQYALLACLQADIYEKSMTKIISDIKKCTEEKQIHSEVKKLLPELPERELVPEMKTEKPTTEASALETYSQIPTISNTRPDFSVNISNNSWTDEPVYNSETYFMPAGHGSEPYLDIHNSNQLNTQTWVCTEGYSESTNLSYWNVGVTQVDNFSLCETKVNSNAVTESPSFIQESSFVNKSIKAKPISRVSPQTLVESKKIDPLLVSRNQLQKSIEQTLDQTDKVNKQRKEEKDRAYIAHILEGEDSVEERFDDSLSDNDNEIKENFNESNLTDRLERMRELFGMEEESQTVIVSTKHKPEENKVQRIPTRSRRPTVWRFEKVIQFYKFSMLSSEMTFERRQRNRLIFLELFGDDSDEEHEEEYRCEEKFRASCTERISSWVVKYLMPYYHDKRIIGRNVFKSLGHYISDTIVDKIQYPDEWTVKYFVSKFFPPLKAYLSDADVLAFQLE